MISFGGIGENVVSFYNGGAIAAAKGKTVKMTGNGQVAQCADGDKFCGVAVGGDAEFTAVQTAGFVTAAYSGTAPAVGYAALLADADGGVKVAAAGGREYLVVEVNTIDKTVGIML